MEESADEQLSLLLKRIAMEEIADAPPGELISITEGSSVVIIEALNDGSLFDLRLTVDRQGEQFSIRLTAKEARKLAVALKEMVIGVKSGGRE